jgi:AraC-like DNA-binding protein
MTDHGVRSLRTISVSGKGNGDTVPIARVVSCPVRSLKTCPGVNVREVCQRLGIDVDLFNDPSARISSEQLALLYEEMALVTGDKDYGLHVGMNMPAEYFDTLLYLTITSSTLWDAMKELSPYAEPVLAGEEISLTRDAELATFSYKVTDKRMVMYRQRSECYLAWVGRFARRAVGRYIVPKAVVFQHPRPADISTHRRLAEAPVYFDGPANQLIFSNDILDLPLPKADPTLHKVLGRYVAERVSELEKYQPENLVETVKTAIINSIGDGVPNLISIAKRAGMSPRTLQRRLNEKRVSLRAMLDEARFDLAKRYLRDVRLSTDEVADRIGYKNVKAFSVAFQRWTKQTPAQYRRTNTLFATASL